MSWWSSKAAERVKFGAASAQIAWSALGPTGPAVLQKMDLQPPMNGAQYSQMVSDNRRKEFEAVYKQGIERDNARMAADPRGEMNRIDQAKQLRESPEQAEPSRSKASQERTKESSSRPGLHHAKHSATPLRDAANAPKRPSSAQPTRPGTVPEPAKTSPKHNRSRDR